ncbi:SpoIIE family protein phosphatase [Streptomyces sp. NBRC 109706]|uniref:SpoIIE family protein phosphatase n=1 Tax=Streptomyces sp. NBRC 109706 TaxID=1550035 RepID=UPI000A64F378|nr:SpoIIE family protein phosphatase [Streptomyces sp. NBRC 109706]
MPEAEQQPVGAIAVRTAQRPGTEPPCADGTHVQRRGGEVTAAVVDGAGHHPDTVQYVQCAAPVITQIGMTLGGLAGLMTAGQMAEAYDHYVHASAVYARAVPGEPTGVHWIGDCRIYGWTGEQTQWSTDQTMGQYLRRHGGVAVDLVEHHDEWARLGLAQASAATCREAEIPAEVGLVLLVSDGVSDQVPDMARLVAEYADDPQALADALVAAAEQDSEGYRDDATAVVLLRP